MPEMHFRVRWPDGSESLCYSPSLVIEEHLAVGVSYSPADFSARAGTALRIASERVQRKYGIPCGRAIGQLAQIDQQLARFAGDETASISIVSFHT